MKRIENILKIFSSITHANGGKSEIFFNVLNFAIPVFMGTYIFLNPLSLPARARVIVFYTMLAMITIVWTLVQNEKIIDITTPN
jgi:hypothetical protein